MASGVRSSNKNSRGFFVQMDNASTSDLLWGGKSFKKSKRNASSAYFAVERLISKKTLGGTVSPYFGFVQAYMWFVTCFCLAFSLLFLRL